VKTLLVKTPVPGRNSITNTGFFRYYSGNSASDDEAHTGSILQSITADTTAFFKKPCPRK
jgi:hypothetical protein